LGFFCQRQRSRPPIEQRDAKVVFQRPDLPAHGGLCDEQLARGFRKAQVARCSLKALKSAGSSRGASTAVATRKGRAAKTAAPAAPRKKGKRARITPELKDRVKAAVVAGKTGAQIASEFGISVPSVQNIKKEFGLVKSRS